MLPSPEPAASSLIWERPEPSSRPTPTALSRERIVQAAIAIADLEGLASVSLRKVAAALDAGPMRLYGYLSTKEDLLDLMADVVYGEIALAGPLPATWRDTLRSLAHRIRQSAQIHPWFIDLMGGRPHQGPNALAFLEATLAALSGAAEVRDIDVVMQAAKTYIAFLTGAIQREASELRMERDSGMNEAEWQAAMWPYFERMIQTGRFPTLASVVREATHPAPDLVFDAGLDCVFDGIAMRLER